MIANNANNNTWITENPLFKSKDQRYYYDFGTGKKVEREEVKEEREAFLNSANKTSTKPQNQKKDDFLEGFDDPYGEKREQERKQKEQERKERLAKIRANADKRTWSSQTDPFLEGFNSETSKEENIWERAFDSVKAGATDVLKKTKEKGSAIINKASAWANEKGFFDDVTNAVFTASNIVQNSPVELLPVDLAQQSLANINQKANERVLLGGYNKEGGYINDQGYSFSQINNLRYGLKKAAENGCGIIAVNNALVSLGNRKDIRDIAKDFEKDGQVLFGAFGTNPYAIGDYFKKQGYQVDSYQGDENIKNRE